MCVERGMHVIRELARSSVERVVARGPRRRREGRVLAAAAHEGLPLLERRVLQRGRTVEHARHSGYYIAAVAWARGCVALLVWLECGGWGGMGAGGGRGGKGEGGLEVSQWMPQ